MKRPGNSGIVLLYNCDGPEFSKLKQIFAMLRLRMHMVGPDKYHVALEDLAHGKGESAQEVPEPIPEAMLVFCGVPQALLNQILEVIRVAKLPPIPLKAILTVHNHTWNTLQLREELLKEREAILAAREQAKAEKEKGESAETAESAETSENAETKETSEPADESATASPETAEQA
jgi:hypothetical protein